MHIEKRVQNMESRIVQLGIKVNKMQQVVAAQSKVTTNCNTQLDNVLKELMPLMETISEMAKFLDEGKGTEE